MPARFFRLHHVKAVLWAAFIAALAIVGPSCSQQEPALAAQTVVQPLPDFAALVKQVGGSVVNVSSVRVPKSGTAGPPESESASEADPLYEFFRRFGIPFEGIPRPSPSTGLGSGFIVSEDGYILTNAHVVEDASEVRVRLTDHREFQAKVVGTDRRSDVATLKIDASGLPAVKIGNPANVRVGDWVAAIGSPFGFENSVTAGIVSATSRSLPDSSYVPFIQTDVAVNPGNSGGPLFNLQGEVIGINSMIYSRTGGYMGVSFAIPINVAMDVRDDLVRHGKVTRGHLGVTIQSVDQDLARSFGLDRPRGAIVSQVEKGGPADKAGLRSGDVILGVGETRIETSGELPGLVAAIDPGTRAELTIWREGERRTLPVTIGTLDGQPAASAGSGKPSTQTGTLGLAVRPLTPEERRKAGGEEGGVMVENASGPAARAGIRPGDIILGVSGQGVDSAEDLRKAASRAGGAVALLVQRGDTQSYIAVTPK